MVVGEDFGLRPSLDARLRRGYRYRKTKRKVSANRKPGKYDWRLIKELGEMMNKNIPEKRSPFIIGYSAILPVAWVTLSGAAYFIVPGRRLGIVGTVLMFMGVAALISWLFARRYRRQFTTSEYWRIIVYHYCPV